MAQGIELRMSGVRKAFGPKQVLHGIDLQIEPGQFAAVVGRSGCGKSTLLRIIAGLDLPDSGAVYLGGHARGGIDPQVRVVFQEHRLLPWKRVLANVTIGSRELETKARGVLEQVGLAEHDRDWPGTLSGGQKQRVALARALLTEPRLLLLDEPLGALDSLTRLEMQSLLERLWLEQGFTALLITHDAEEAVALADRVILIEQGQVTLDLVVDLPRPRDRESVAFGVIKAAVRDRLMNRPQEQIEILADQPVI